VAEPRGADGEPPAAPAGARGRRTLRSRLLASTLTVTALAVVAFGVPLGLALASVERDRFVLRLESEASRIIAVVPDERLLSTGTGAPALPAGPSYEDQRMAVGLYSSSGARLTGTGPAHSTLAIVATRSGGERVGVEHGDLAVSLSLLADRPSRAAVRVAVPQAAVNEETWENSWAMAALAAVVLILAWVAASVLGRRVNRPLEALARDAARLGEGDFTVRTSRSGLAEVDAVGATLDATAGRIGDLLGRERSFSANASHQLRTPISALRLHLESATLVPGSDLAAVTRDAVHELDRLEDTLDRLLALARDVHPPAAPVDLAAALGELQRRWAPVCARRKRRLEVDSPGDRLMIRGSAASLAHVLDVLVDNAVQHGAGTIRVAARRLTAGVALDVADEGPGVPADADGVFRRRSDLARGHGIGLALARALMEADGGRLELTRPGPGPVFTVLLPVPKPESDPVASGVRS
jgi:signal transduction histidine kinase